MALSPTASTSRRCGRRRRCWRRGSLPRRTSTRRWSTGSTGPWARWRWWRGRARAGSEAAPPRHTTPEPRTQNREPGASTAAVSDQPPPRVAPYAFPERYALPARPTGEQPAVQDAHRQTHFLLPAELALFEQAMNLQLAVIAAGAKRRSPEAAALLGFWSRTFAYLSDACVLLGRASYASCPPLLRAACDCIAAQRSLIADGFEEYHEWLASALGKDREHAASYI